MSQDSLMLFIFSRGIKTKIYYYFHYIDKNVKKRHSLRLDRYAGRTIKLILYHEYI